MTQPDTKPLLRELRSSDYASCQALHSRNGLSRQSENTWAALWTGAPFTPDFHDVPWGWVLESPDGHLVGALANVPMLFLYGGRPLRAAVSGSWAVDAAWRHLGIGLLSKFMSQRNVDLLFNLQASVPSAKLTHAMKAAPVPCAGYDVARFLPVSFVTFAAAGLAKKKVPLAGALAWLAAPALRYRSRNDVRIDRAGLEIVQLDNFDDRFDSFWTKIQGSGLIALRSAAALRWRFPSVSLQGPVRLLGLLRGGELCGYLVLRRVSRTSLRGLPTDLVEDWQTAGQDENAAALLLDAARHLSRQAGGAALEVRGWCEWKQRLVNRFHPVLSSPDSPRSFVKILDPALRQELANPDLWDLSSFERF